MEQSKILGMIRDLSNASGASGFEDDTLAVLRKYGAGLGRFEEDSLRNLYLLRSENRGNHPVIQLDAHSDEVSFMIQAVKPNGTLRFIPLGGWVANNIPAHKVRVRNADGEYVPGIVAAKPPHFMSDAEKNMPASIDRMVIDIGASSYEEAVNDFKIQIGAPVVPDVKFDYDEAHDLMMGKAFDCRLGCACILATLDALKGQELSTDLVAGFSSQEEVGTRGATVAANHVKSDIAIVFEGCPADDTFSEPYMIQTAIKRGPMLRHIDARMITNPRFQRFALNLAKENGIPVQESVRTGGSTNGAPIHISNAGVPAIVIGLPVRYIHSHYGIASLADCVNAAKLAVSVIEHLDADIVKTF